MMRLALPALLMLASACTKPVVVDGTVTDVWGAPISGATVRLEGVVEGASTDNTGAFKFELKDPRSSFRVQAGKEGYIPGVTSVESGEEGSKEFPSAAIKLYPEPKQPGFYAVNLQDFAHLEGLQIRTVGTDVFAFTGVPTEGDVRVISRGPMEFVFASTLKASELSRLNLQLHRMEFVEKTELPGVLGDMEVRVNLWVARETVDFDLQGLPRQNTYLITTRDPLSKGVYAFSTQGVLTSSDSEAADKLPKEMRVAYIFHASN